MINHLKRLILIISLFGALPVMAQFEDCTNGIDDDSDGYIDCFDSNCSGSSACSGVELNCNNGLDDDGDGLPDCLDIDCRYSGICPVESDCNNGIDDDGDGYFDYYDGDCLSDPNNPNDFISDMADCQVIPTGNAFDIEAEWQSSATTSGVYAQPIVADLDNDGIPEVISTNEKGKTLTILNGKDGSTIRSMAFSQLVGVYPAVADVDGDGFGEIFIFDRVGKITAYNHDLTPLWSTYKRAPINDSRMINIADFNQDGEAEIYYANEIRQAKNGYMIIKGSHDDGSMNRQWDQHINAVSVAADILDDSYCADCSGLELILGNIIYSVDIENKELTEVLNMDNASSKSLVNPVGGLTYGSADLYRPKIIAPNLNYSSTSLADVNQDGNLDVILSGTINDEINGPTMVFFWDVANDRVRARVITRPYAQIDPLTVGSYNDVAGGTCDSSDGECTWSQGMGVVNIANIDDDDQLELTFISGSSLYALDDALMQEWANHDDFWETSSGFTGTTVFDFDGDGSSEIVYRDEIDLYIVDGVSGKPLSNDITSSFCSSQTQAEYPVVADVDGDGETEIVVSCGCAENTKTNLATDTNRECGFIRTYKAANNNYWVPSRKVWNQFSYFNVNVNDNLSIPQYQQKHHLGFTDQCDQLATGADKFALNKFNNQSPVIDYCGNISFPAANLEFVNDSIQVNPPVCPNDVFQVRIQMINDGDKTIYQDIPVSFYSNDPTATYTNVESNPYLQTTYISLPNGLKENEILDTVLTVNGKAGSFTLYASLNDIGPFDAMGSSLPNDTFYPLDSLNGPIRECNALPTIGSKDVVPLPFNTTAVWLKDSDYCPGAMNSNGAVTANVAGDTAAYIFRWYRGDSIKATPDYIGATQTALDTGIYTVMAEHIMAGCIGNTDTVRVNSISSPSNIVTQIVSQQESCNPTEPSGSLSAYVDVSGTAVTSGYDFFWYKGSSSVTPAKPGYSGGPTVDGLSEGTYRLLVTNTASGCSNFQDIYLPSNINNPVISQDSISHITSCTSGVGMAAVSVDSAVTSDFTFYWMAGNVSSPDTTGYLFKGATQNNLGAGEYTVYAFSNSFGCPSQAINLEILDLRQYPVINPVITQSNTSCDITAPNGQLNISVDESASSGNSAQTLGYNFAIYQGTYTKATLPATPFRNGSSVLVPAGNYTILVTNSVTGCNSISYASLSDDIQKPVIDPAYTLTHATNCSSPWGSQISVTADSGKTHADNYNFIWRNVDTNTLLPDTTATISDLPPGNYSVIVRNNTTQCDADNEEFFTIEDHSVPVDVDFIIYPQESCNSEMPTGVVVAQPSSGSPDDYTFEWFDHGSGGPIFVPGGPISFNDTIYDVRPNDITLTLTHKVTRCQVIKTIHVPLDKKPIFLDTANVIPPNDCRETLADIDLSLRNSNPGIVNASLMGNRIDLSFAPDTFGISHVRLLARDQDGGYHEEVFTVNIPAPTNIIYRENSNGPLLPATNPANPPWTADYNAIPSAYRTNGTGRQSFSTITMDASVPAQTRKEIFNRIFYEASGSPMSWAYPAPAGSSIEVRLYMQEYYRDDVGERVFDVKIDGTVVDPALDVFAVAGGRHIGIMRSYVITSDGMIDIDFNRIVSDPMVCALEFIALDGPQVEPPVAFEPMPHVNVQMGSAPITVDLTNYFKDNKDLAENLTYSVSSSDMTIANASVSTDQLTVIPSSTNTGLATITVNATDSDGNTSQDNFTIYVGNDSVNTAPYVVNPILDVEAEINGPSLSINVSDVFTDQEDGYESISSQIQITHPFEPVAFDSTIIRTYEYRIYEGPHVPNMPIAWTVNDNSKIPIAVNNTGLFTGLRQGVYTAYAKDLYGNCWSHPFEFFFEGEIATQMEIDTLVHPTSCTSVGSIGFKASTDDNMEPSGKGYSFEWFFHGNSRNNPETPNPGDTLYENSFTTARENLVPGYYRIDVYDSLSQCSMSYFHYLQLADPPVLTVDSLQHLSSCLPGDGIAYTSLIKSATSLELDQYRILLFEGNTIDPGNHILERTPLSSTDTLFNFTGLQEGEYTLAVEEILTACFTQQLNFTLNKASQPPTFVFTPQTDYTCNANGMGSINVDVTGADGETNQANFTFEWFYGNDTTSALPPASLNVIDPSVAENLEAGQYTVKVTDNSGYGQGCSFMATYVLQYQSKTINITQAEVSLDTLCIANTGSIYVSYIEEAGINTDPDNYYYSLYDTSYLNMGGPISVTGTGVVTDPFTGLAQGQYYIRAIDKVTGCQSGLFNVRIEEETYRPSVTITVENPDFSCNGTNYTGQVRATATGQGDGDTSNFTFEWFEGANNTDPADQLPINPSDEKFMTGLMAGEYTLRVTDTGGHSNGCSITRNFTIGKIDKDISISLLRDHSTICLTGNGAIHVNEVIEEYTWKGVDYSNSMPITDYTFELLDQDANTLAATGNGTPSDPFRGLSAGEYAVRATSALNCTSLPVTVTVEDLSRRPLVQIGLVSEQLSMSPDPANWTGSLQAQVAVSPTNPLDSIADAFSYNYRWYRADQYPSGSYIATTALVDRLDTGTYILEVTNTVTGCSNTASYRLEASFMNAELSVSNTDQTYCSGNAVINLEQVTYGNYPADPNDFIFLLYYEADTATAIDSVSYTPGMPLFENLENGTYLVKARHNSHFIYTEFVEVQINFMPMVTVIDLITDQLRPQISCDPLVGTGALAINITSPAPGQNLIITWYSGMQVEASQQIIVQDPFFVDNLSSGYYTVNVLDQVSGCQTQQTFFVEDQSQQPVVLADSSPSTTCDPSLANGSVMASVNKAGSYTFSWYVGNDTTGSAQHQGARWSGLTPGNYTVVATDNQTGTCTGIQTVTVNNASQSPRVNINVVSHDTACDPTLANGVLIADIEFPIYEYDFRWYDQNGNQVGNYSMLGKASQGIYALEVTYLPTGCVSRTQAMVRNIPVIYPEPTIEVNAHQTNCGEPDGSASARMQDYDMAFTFTWYDQRGNRLPDEQVSYDDVLSTSTATGLAAGTYSVQATSSVTGCTTPVGRITIQDESQTADFTIEAEPASCSLANGVLKVSTSAQTNIVSISWFNTLTGESFESERVLENATAGDYEFTITWENGCTTEGTTTLEAEVSVFNGVSPNGDGDNEVFWIDCIERYPFNVVKIFNRAGALIYQESGYDNKSVYFDGTGNKGIYVDSNNLPAGTYFYVIEFNDGEKKPVTGYLELFR